MYKFNIATEKNTDFMNAGTPMIVSGIEYVKQAIKELDVEKKEFIGVQIAHTTGYRVAKDFLPDKWSGLLSIDLDDHKNALELDWDKMIDFLEHAKIPGLNWIQKSKGGHGLHLIFKCKCEDLDLFSLFAEICNDNLKKAFADSIEISKKYAMNEEDIVDYTMLPKIDEMHIEKEKGKFYDAHLSLNVWFLNFSGFPIHTVDFATELCLDMTEEGIANIKEEIRIRNINAADSRSNYLYGNVAKQLNTGRSIEDGLFDYIQKCKLYESLPILGLNANDCNRNIPRKSSNKRWKISNNSIKVNKCSEVSRNSRYVGIEFKHEHKKCYIVNTSGGKTYFVADKLVNKDKILYCTYRTALVEDCYATAYNIYEQKNRKTFDVVAQNFTISKGNQLNEDIEYGVNIITTIQSLSTINEESWKLLEDYEIFIDEIHLFDEFDNENTTRRLMQMPKASCYTASLTDLTRLYVTELGFEIIKIKLEEAVKHNLKLVWFNNGNPFAETYKNNSKKNLINLIDFCLDKKMRPLVYVNDKDIISTVQKHYGKEKCIAYFTMLDETKDNRLLEIKADDKIVCTTSKLGVGVSYHNRFDAVIVISEDWAEIQQITHRERDNDLVLFLLLPTYSKKNRYVVNSDARIVDYTLPYFGKTPPMSNVFNKEWRNCWKVYRRELELKNIDFTVMSVKNALKESFVVTDQCSQGFYSVAGSLEKISTETHFKNIRWKVILAEVIIKLDDEKGDNAELSDVEKDYVQIAVTKCKHEDLEEDIRKWNSKKFKSWMLGETEDDWLDAAIEWKKKQGYTYFVLSELLDKMEDEPKKDLAKALVKIRYKYNTAVKGWVDPREAVGKNNHKCKTKQEEYSDIIKKYLKDNKGPKGMKAALGVNLFRWYTRHKIEFQ